MNLGIKILLGLLILLAGAYLFVSTVTATPKEAIANCYTEAQRDFDIYKEKLASTEQKQAICIDQKGEIESLKQCVNNAYAKYGHYQSALARRRLFMGSNDPLAQLIADHNQICGEYSNLTVE